MQKYTMRIVKCGRILEVYNYLNPKFFDYTMFERNQGSNSKEERSELSNNRSGFFIRCLVNCNPLLNKFLTLTYKENVQNVKKSNYDFNKFIKRLKYQLGNFKYIAIIEFQKRGAIHYHLICDFPFVDISLIAKIWGFGFCFITETKDVQNIGAYFAKHGTKKSQSDDQKLYKQKKYFCSRGLEKPLIIKQKNRINEFYNANKNKYGLIYESEFGYGDNKVFYEQYILNN